MKRYIEEPIISLRGVGKEFEKELRVLNGIDLDIMRGEIFGVIGLSGAGKSTMVRCINLLERPTEGEVFYDGRKISSMKEKELRKVRQNMGMIFQQFHLLEQRTVLKNVCFPLEIAGVRRKEAEQRARELLTMVGLAEKADAYPSMLSGGQKQRVAIARALATKPEVLLCDEATSALDPETTRSILALLKEINRTMGVTIVLITHQMQAVKAICDRVAILDHSRIAETGTAEQIFRDPHSRIGRKLLLGDPEENTEEVQRYAV